MEDLMVAGKEASPHDAEATHRIKAYWSKGKGAALIAWSTPGAYDRCLTHLGKYVHDDHMLHGLCANLAHDATGEWPGAHQGNH
jgi:hypothetical protein